MVLLSVGQITVEIAVLEQEHFTQSSTYNLGSSATLICHAQDAIGSVSYQWSSTSSEFFAYNSTAMFNKKMQEFTHAQLQMIEEIQEKLAWK